MIMVGGRGRGARVLLMISFKSPLTLVVGDGTGVLGIWDL